MHSATHSEPPPPFERTTIGRYDIIYPLASGGMATIYVGRLSGMAGFEKLVALKVIHAHLATQRQFVEMFFDEARLAARIHHPNIGEVYEIIEDSGDLFMATEFVDGRNLRQLQRAAREQKKHISHPLSAWTCAEVCQGLQTVHDLTDDEGYPLNLVHRDISPSNILLSYNGWVKLIDFGIAFAENRLAHTMPGSVKGKVGYISPEQLKGEPLDRRADIFSVGVILYQLVTGRHPFQGRSDAERLRKTIQYELVRPSKISTNIDRRLEDIILKAIAESPKERYQNASSLERDLRQYVAMTREVTGASDVAHLMQGLFADRKTSHQEKLSEFRQKTPSSPWVMYPSRDHTESSHVSGEIEAADASAAEVTGPHIGKMKFSSRDLALFAVIGGVIASVLTAGVFYLLSGASDKSSPHQVDNTAAIEGNMTFLSPGADTHQISSSSVKKKAHDTGATEESNRVVASATIKVSVSLQPVETELSVNGEAVEVEANTIRLPSDGRPCDVVASAPGYITETYTIVPKKGDALAVELERSIPKKSTPSPKARASKRRKPNKKKVENKSQRVLKRNPY